MKLKIAVLSGGNSSEAEISIKSGRQVANWIDKEKFAVYPIIIMGTRWTLGDEDGPVINKTDFSVIKNGEKIKFDFAYIIVHGTPGENGLMSGYFELLGIPHSTCNTLVSSLTFDKYFCKLALRDINILMAKAILVKKNQKITPEEIAKAIGLPCFIKPNAGGSSCGTSKVKTIEEIPAALEFAFKEDSEVIIEEFIKGTEISNGVIVTKKKTIVFPITEIVPKNEFFDYEAKYTPGMSEEITPARIPDHVRNECWKLSQKIYEFLGCKGIVRVDYIIRDEKLYFLEINTIPGMSEASIIPQQGKVYGITMTELLTTVIEDILN
jgi:D-alanine-D-alanine ligase